MGDDFLRIINFLISMFKRIFRRNLNKNYNNLELNNLVEGILKMEENSKVNFLDKLTQLTKENKVKWNFCGN